MSKLKVVELFAGVGGFRIGAIRFVRFDNLGLMQVALLNCKTI